MQIRSSVCLILVIKTNSKLFTEEEGVREFGSRGFGSVCECCVRPREPGMLLNEFTKIESDTGQTVYSLYPRCIAKFADLP